MQAINTPASIHLPFITIHFLTELSANTIKSIDDVPHTAWYFTDERTAETGKVYLRFDLSNFNTNAIDQDRAKKLILDGIIGAVSAVNYVRGKDDFKSNFLHLSGSSDRFGNSEKSTKGIYTSVVDNTWQIITRLHASLYRIEPGADGANKFGRVRDKNGKFTHQLNINLGNAINIFFFKPLSQNAPVNYGYDERRIEGKAIILGDAEYRYTMVPSLWIDKTPDEALRFVPHDDILRRVEKGVKELFDELLGGEVNVARIVGIGRE